MSTITLLSESATKKQNTNAKVLFGTKGETIVKTIELLIKAKQLDTSVLTHVMEVLKDDAKTAKYATNAVGKKNVLALKLLLKAKTVFAAIDVIAKVKVPKAFA